MLYGFRTYALGTLIGAAIVGGLAGLLRLPPAIAEELDTRLADILPPVGAVIDPDALVRFKDRDYSVTYEDWVDTNPIERTTIRKIAFGKTTFVTVTTTDAGAFSSEALFSPHVRYPGVHVTAAPRAPAPLTAIHWGGSRGWVETQLVDAGSFVFVPPGTPGDGAVIGNGLACTFGRTYAVC